MENTDTQTIPDFLQVFISANTATSGIVEVPGQGWSTPFTVQANKTVEIHIPTNVAMVTSYETNKGMGVHITANDPVTVYALNYFPMSSDATIVLPIQSIGKEYIIQAKSETYTSNFLIAAINNNTKIEITPSNTTSTGRKAKNLFNITLNRGEVYQVASQDNGDITGTKVRVTDGVNNIAVFGGAVCTRVGNCGCCCNHLFEQMFPVNRERMKEYITVPYETRRGDIFRILAVDDSTKVVINNKGGHLLNANQYFDTLMATPGYIKSNNTLSVAQLSRSHECDGVMSSDPFMIMLSSIDMTLDEITFNAFETSIIDNYFVNIIAPLINLDSIFLDGNSITSFFSAVPSNPNFAYARINISPGDHTLKGSQGVIAYVYGYGVRESYGYSAGINILNDFVTTQCPQVLFNPGDTIKYPILLSKTNAILTVGTHKFQTQLSFNKNLLFPVLDSTMTYKNDGKLILNRKAQDIQLPAVLAEIPFITMLGDSECTTLTIDTLIWDGIQYPMNVNCQICMNLCKEGGTRLVLSTQKASLSQNSPNPARTYTNIKYEIIEKGYHQLYLVDIYGNKIETIRQGIMDTGSYDVTIDASTLADGVYFYILQTPTRTFSRKMNVIR